MNEGGRLSFYGFFGIVFEVDVGIDVEEFVNDEIEENCYGGGSEVIDDDFDVDVVEMSRVYICCIDYE